MSNKLYKEQEVTEEVFETVETPEKEEKGKVTNYIAKHKKEVLLYGAGLLTGGIAILLLKSLFAPTQKVIDAENYTEKTVEETDKQE